MKTSDTKAILAAVPLVLALTLTSPSAAVAGDRPGDAALGALSGAVVLGPIGAVAGAVVGYTAGPSIAHSLGFRRSAAARGRAPTRQARAAAGNREYAAGNQAPPPAATPPFAAAPQEAANVTPAGPRIARRRRYATSACASGTGFSSATSNASRSISCGSSAAGW
jgi:hypothetical protein